MLALVSDTESTSVVLGTVRSCRSRWTWRERSVGPKMGVEGVDPGEDLDLTYREVSTRIRAAGSAFWECQKRLKASSSSLARDLCLGLTGGAMLDLGVLFFTWLILTTLRPQSSHLPPLP